MGSDYQQLPDQRLVKKELVMTIAFLNPPYYWQRILWNEMYIERRELPVSDPLTNETPVAFVELKPAVSEQETGSSFRLDAIFRSQDITLEISNTVFWELIKQLGGLFHAE